MKYSQYRDPADDRRRIPRHRQGTADHLPGDLRFLHRSERVTLADGHLRARLTISDGSLLESSEYVQRSPDGRIDVVTYNCHRADADGNLVRRWDNTPNFPGLPGFPHHVHDGRAGSVVPGRPVNVFLVLDEITRLLA